MDSYSCLYRLDEQQYKKWTILHSLVVQLLGLHFHCSGFGFNPWSGNYDPTNHTAWPKKLNLKMNQMSDTKTLF